MKTNKQIIIDELRRIEDEESIHIPQKRNIATKILSKLKIPEEKGVVIAEGKITKDLPYSEVINKLLAANIGKELKIILERKKRK